MSNSSTRLARIERAFWALWLLFGAAFVVTAAGLSNPGGLVDGLTDEQRRCLELFPRPGTLSGTGAAIFWSSFVLDVVPYAAMMAIMHRTVRRFRDGDMLVEETIAGLRLAAIILIAWPFLGLIKDNLASWVLRATGDVNFSAVTLALDVPPLAGGLFMLAMAKAIEHAVSIKTEHDLTI